jgi:DNA-binding XRE family transcriptional regulator
VSFGEGEQALSVQSSCGKGVGPVSQGEPTVVVFEESHDFTPTVVASIVTWITRALDRATARRKEAAAISEKNENQGCATVRHVAPERATRNFAGSHARSVFMVTDLPSALGQRVRLRRAELDLSQIALAMKAGVGRRTVQRMETTGTMPQAQTAHKIATALGRSMAWLEGGAEGAEHGNDRSEGDGR